MRRKLKLMLMVSALAIPPAAFTQTTHEDAKAQVEAKDAQTHAKAKTTGVGTVAGAAAGAAGGPAGAIAGAKTGHAVGAVAHTAKKKRDIHEVEKHGTPSDGAAPAPQAAPSSDHP